MSQDKAENNLNFEAALDELNTIVEKMESGDLSLEDSLKQFERGIALTRKCQTTLKQAEQHVQVLVQTQQGDTLEAFDDKDDA